MVVQKQAKHIVAQHQTQPPHQNRLGLSVGAAGRAPEDDTQVTTNSLPCIISLPLRVQSFSCVTMQHVQSCNSVRLVSCHSASVVSINIRIMYHAVQ